MLDKRAILLAKDEVTYNTDSVPVAGTDAILVEGLSWSFASARMVQRKPVRASFSMLRPLFAGTLIAVKGKAEIKGSGAAGTAPEIANLLRGAGWAETVVGGVSVTYKPTSTQASIKSQSMYFYDDGLLLKMTGCRGKCSFNLQVGQNPMLDFDFTGHYVSLTDIALPSATYDSTVPVPLVNVPFSAFSYSALVSKLAFDMGVEVVTPEVISAADGYGEVQIVGRNVTGSFNPQRVAVATKDFVSIWRAGTTGTLDTGVIGGTAGNRFQVTMPAIAISEVGRGNEKQVGTYEIKFAAAENTGDDDVSIAFT